MGLKTLISIEVQSSNFGTFWLVRIGFLLLWEVGTLEFEENPVIKCKRFNTISKQGIG